MTTQQVADRYYALSSENKYDVIVAELYDENIESIEPSKNGIPSLQNVKGKAAKAEKDKRYGESIEEMIGGYCDAPIVAGNSFAVKMGMEAKYKVIGLLKMDEIAVFEVEDGKIIKETFFF